jgi:uncharacterized protein
MRTTIAMGLLSLVVVSSARAATFDCDKAASFAEKVVCSDSRITAMDDELGSLYKAALASSPNKDTLKADQKAWLASRDRCKDDHCIMKAYADRIAALKGANNASAASVTGTYTVKGGELRVQQTGDQIKFFLNATHEANVGEVSGEAKLSGETAGYSDTDIDCNLSFKFSSDKVNVTQNGGCGMGLNVSGSGTYKRTSTAAPEFDE